VSKKNWWWNGIQENFKQARKDEDNKVRQNKKVSLPDQGVLKKYVKELWKNNKDRERIIGRIDNGDYQIIDRLQRHRQDGHKRTERTMHGFDLYPDKADGGKSQEILQRLGKTVKRGNDYKERRF